MKTSGIGGQAVIEGVMMRNGGKYAVAVRKPDGEIEVKLDSWESWLDKHQKFNLPFVRGVFNFVDSLIMGMQIITYSASFFEEDEDKSKSEEQKKKDAKKEDFLMSIVTVLSVVLALTIFMILPMTISNFFRKIVKSPVLMGLIEGLVRLAIFIGYVCAISLMKDIRRVYMYHGAEHKCINCVEHGLDLTVENVRKSSKQHKRCGTSFLLFVVLVSIVFSMIVQTDVLWLRIGIRILLIPVIAGISYEILRLAGRSENKLIDLISKPGLLLQGLTTREPDDQMIEVAISSVEAVFDWKKFESEAFGKTYEE